jgi:hypothetical protein
MKTPYTVYKNLMISKLTTSSFVDNSTFTLIFEFLLSLRVCANVA